MKYLKILLFFLFSTASVVAQDKTISYRDANDTFTGIISSKEATAPLPPADVTHFLMKSYSLKIRWRTYIGEPLERYEFEWEASKHYTIDVEGVERRMHIDSLKKYPDLRKRFLDLRPTRVDIKLNGTAGGRTKDEMGAFGVGRITIPGLENFDAINYNYIVKDDDLLIGPSGWPKLQWVDSAPDTWYEFINWGGAGTKTFNLPNNKFKRLSSKEKSGVIKDIKKIWKQINAISITGAIETLEWPEYEMIDIIKTYDRYKNKKKELSPLEKMEAELAKVQRITEYTKNDDWGKLPELTDPMPNIAIKKTSFKDVWGEPINKLIDKDTGNEISLKNDFSKEYDHDLIKTIIQGVDFSKFKDFKLSFNPIGILLDKFILYQIGMKGRGINQPFSLWEIVDFNGKKAFTFLSNHPRKTPMTYLCNFYFINKKGDVFYFSPNHWQFDNNFNLKLNKRDHGKYLDWRVPINIYLEAKPVKGHVISTDGPFVKDNKKVLPFLNYGKEAYMIQSQQNYLSETYFSFYDNDFNFKGYLKYKKGDYFESN